MVNMKKDGYVYVNRDIFIIWENSKGEMWTTRQDGTKFANILVVILLCVGVIGAVINFFELKNIISENGLLILLSLKGIFIILEYIGTL